MSDARIKRRLMKKASNSNASDNKSEVNDNELDGINGEIIVEVYELYVQILPLFDGKNTESCFAILNCLLKALLLHSNLVSENISFEAAHKRIISSYNNDISEFIESLIAQRITPENFKIWNNDFLEEQEGEGIIRHILNPNWRNIAAKLDEDSGNDPAS